MLFFLANGPAINVSSKNAATHIIGNSLKAATNIFKFPYILRITIPVPQY